MNSRNRRYRLFIFIFTWLHLAKSSKRNEMGKVHPSVGEIMVYGLVNRLRAEELEKLTQVFQLVIRLHPGYQQLNTLIISNNCTVLIGTSKNVFKLFLIESIILQEIDKEQSFCWYGLLHHDQVHIFARQKLVVHSVICYHMCCFIFVSLELYTGLIMLKIKCLTSRSPIRVHLFAFTYPRSPIRVHLSASCASWHVVHKASTLSRQPALSAHAAAVCTSLQFFHPALSPPLSAVLRHIVLGLPRAFVALPVCSSRLMRSCSRC